MNTTHRLQLVAAAALVAAAPVTASAAQTAYAVTPIAVGAISDTQNSFSIPYASQRRYLNDLSVDFTNQANVAANVVSFSVTRDGKTELIAARGTYAPGAEIRATLASETSTLPEGNATVKLARVDFADGSTWTAQTGLVAAR